MAHPIDIHVGKRLRQRRCLLGLTQQKLATAVGIKFQQIQKYESGANRVSASRLWALANAMGVSVAYFFDELGGAGIIKDANSETNDVHGGDLAAMDSAAASEDNAGMPANILNDKETIALVRAYYNMDETPRKRLLDLAKTLSGA